VLAAWIRWELTVLPDPLAGLTGGVEEGKGWREAKVKGEGEQGTGRKGRGQEGGKGLRRERRDGKGKGQIAPGSVASYDIWPGNGAGLFFQLVR